MLLGFQVLARTIAGVLRETGGRLAMRCHRHLSLFAFVTMAFAGAAAEFSSTTLNTDDGLPSQSVTSMSVGCDGTIWVGTRMGLARFDGKSFENFTLQNSPGMPSDDITAVLDDRSTGLWVGTARGMFWVGAVGIRPVNGMPPIAVRAIVSGEPGNIWAATDQGICLVRRRDGQKISDGQTNPAVYAEIVDQFRSTDGLMSDDVRQLELAPDGRLLAETALGWQELNPTSRKFVAPPIDRPVTLNNVPGRVVFRRSLGQWCAVNSGVYEWVKNTWQERWRPPLDKPLMSHRFFEDTRDRLWLCLPSGESMLWDGTTFRSSVRLAKEQFYDLQAVASDREGNVWLGTQNGLIMVTARPVNIHRPITDSQGASDLRSVSIAPDGKIWLGTRDSAFEIVNGNARRITHDPVPDPTAPYLVQAVASGAWIAQGRILQRYQRGSGLQTVGDVPAERGRIHTIHLDMDGSVWVGHEHGAEHWAGGNRVDMATLSHLNQSSVRCILRTKNGSMWFGTWDNGLIQWDGRKWNVYGNGEDLGATRIQALVEGSNGRIWIGTSQGLACFTESRIHSFTQPDELRNSAIHHLAVDSRSYLWIGALRGLFRVSMPELERTMLGRSAEIHVVSLGISQGMNTAGTSAESHPVPAMTPNGHLWFPTPVGIAEVDVGAVEENSSPPVPWVRKVVVDGRVEVGQHLVHSGCASSGSPASMSISLPKRRGQIIEIHYTANTADQASRVKFQYRLRGYDTEWRDAQDRRVAVYTDLDPGSYDFELKAANGQGYWSKAASVLRVRRPPGFLEHPVFRISCALAGLAAAAMLIRRNLVTQRERLLAENRALEAERARIAKDLHDDVGANLTGLALQAELAGRRGPPEVAASFDGFARGARHLVDHLREIIWAINPACDKLESLVRYLLEYAENFLDSAGIRCRLDVPDSVPEMMANAEVRHQLLLVLKEALNNAIRHGKATEVEVRLRLSTERMHLVVKDNGVGFDEANQVESPSGAEGMGLKSMRDRMRLLGGTIQFSPGESGGTTVIAALPLSVLQRPDLAKLRNLSNFSGEPALKRPSTVGTARYNPAEPVNTAVSGPTGERDL